LKRAQEELERERAALEETRRRQMEFQTGRQELIQNLTRGLGLLEEAEFNVRRDAEQMAKTLAELRDALEKMERIHEETWTQDNFNVELTRALTTIENARMEWNSARLKFPLLSGQRRTAAKRTAPEIASRRRCWAAAASAPCATRPGADLAGGVGAPVVARRGAGAVSPPLMGGTETKLAWRYFKKRLI